MRCGSAILHFTMEKSLTRSAIPALSAGSTSSGPCSGSGSRPEAEAQRRGPGAGACAAGDQPAPAAGGAAGGRTGGGGAAGTQAAPQAAGPLACLQGACVLTLAALLPGLLVYTAGLVSTSLHHSATVVVVVVCAARCTLAGWLCVLMSTRSVCLRCSWPAPWWARCPGTQGACCSRPPPRRSGSRPGAAWGPCPGTAATSGTSRDAPPLG
jgi:hypothetical protein